jgi:hypothetical protein
MKISLTESQIKNLVVVLTEAFEAMPFKIDYEDTESIQYGFDLNGLHYWVEFFQEDEPYEDYEGGNIYSLSFGFIHPDGNYEKNPQSNSNFDLKHLNTVLFTVAKITEDFVKNHPDLEELLIYASYDKERGESDADDIANIRTRIYARFLKTMDLNIKSFSVDEEANRIFLFFKE